MTRPHHHSSKALNTNLPRPRPLGSRSTFLRPHRRRSRTARFDQLAPTRQPLLALLTRTPIKIASRHRREARQSSERVAPRAYPVVTMMPIRRGVGGCHDGRYGATGTYGRRKRRDCRGDRACACGCWAAAGFEFEFCFEVVAACAGEGDGGRGEGEFCAV